MSQLELLAADLLPAGSINDYCNILLQRALPENKFGLTVTPRYMTRESSRGSVVLLLRQAINPSVAEVIVYRIWQELGYLISEGRSPLTSDGKQQT